MVPSVMKAKVHSDCNESAGAGTYVMNRIGR
jgi:hypothetical protein